MKDYSKENLERLGFRPSSYLSNYEETYYVYRFTVYRYRYIPTIEADIIVRLEDGEVSIDVFDKNTHGKYAAWYCRNVLGYFGENRVVEEIDRLIAKKLKQLGIKEVG